VSQSESGFCRRPSVSPATRLSTTDSLVFESSPDCVKVLDLDGCLAAMNRNGRSLMEVDDFAALCGQP
jgi:hypothetical protein